MEELRSCLVCHADLAPGVTYIAPLLEGGAMTCLRQVCPQCGEVYDQAPVHRPGPPLDQMTLPPIDLPPLPQEALEPSRVIFPNDYRWHHGNDRIPYVPPDRSDDIVDSMHPALFASQRFRLVPLGQHTGVSQELIEKVIKNYRRFVEDRLRSDELKGFSLRKDDDEKGDESDERTQTDHGELPGGAGEQE